MKFRKKPVVIDAMQWTGGNLKTIQKFTKGGATPRDCLVDGHNCLIIKTLEGEHIASKGDWRIRGVKGESYPCKPDIFEMTYEPVQD